MPDGELIIVLFTHPSSGTYNIASKVVATVSVEDVNENVNLYRDSGSIDQSTKNDLLATVPSPIDENKTNNKNENLRWLPRSENTRRSHLGRPEPKKGRLQMEDGVKQKN